MASSKNTTHEVNTFEAKQQALATAIESLEKEFGKGAVMKLGENAGKDIACVPTGSLSLDIALGVGGYPKEGLSRFTVRSLPVRQRSHFTR